MLEFVASVRAALVSSDTGGGGPEIEPVFCPTIEYVSVAIVCDKVVAGYVY